MKQNFIACIGNVRWSLKVPCVIYMCTSVLFLTRRQKSTGTLYMSVYYNRDVDDTEW